MGDLAASIGDSEVSLLHYRQALRIRRAIGDRGGQAATLGRMADMFAVRGQHAKALQQYTQALSLLRSLEDRRGEAWILSGLGTAYWQSGKLSEALDRLESTLPIFRSLGDRAGEAVALRRLASVHTDLTSPLRAMTLLRESHQLSEQLGDPDGQAESLYQMARVHAQSGDLRRACEVAEAAVLLTERQRSRVGSASKRVLYLAAVRNYYDLLIDLLMQRHRTAPSEGHGTAAFLVSERARARSLLETLTESGHEIRRGVDPALLERRQSLQKRLEAQTEFLLLGNAYSLTPQEAQAAGRELQRLTTEFERVEAAIRTSNAAYAALTQPPAPDLAAIQREILDENSLLLEYALGAERSYLWALTRSSLASFELPGRSEIESRVRQFYSLLAAANASRKGEAETQRAARLKSAKRQIRESAGALGRVLLGPVAGQLGGGRLLIVAEGGLQYLPFAALAEPRELEKATARTFGAASGAASRNRELALGFVPNGVAS